jgi:hypothetical protein
MKANILFTNSFNIKEISHNIIGSYKKYITTATDRKKNLIPRQKKGSNMEIKAMRNQSLSQIIYIIQINRNQVYQKKLTEQLNPVKH